MKILCVEDHSDTSLVYCKLIGAMGHEVMAVATYAQAIAALETYSFDVMVADIGLPGRSGIQLVKEIRKRASRLPCIAISGYGMQDDIDKGMEAGFDIYLVKPITIEDLFKVLEKVPLVNGRPESFKTNPLSFQ